MTPSGNLLLRRGAFCRSGPQSPPPNPGFVIYERRRLGKPATLPGCGGRSLSPPSSAADWALPPSVVRTIPSFPFYPEGERSPFHFPLGLRGSHVLLAVARRPDRATKSFWKRELGVRSRFLSPCVVKKASWNLMLEAVDCRANGLQTNDRLVYEEVLQEKCCQNAVCFPKLQSTS